MGLGALVEKAKSIVTSKEYPVYNVKIDIKGWNGPFSSRGQLKRMIGHVDEARLNYEGFFYVTNSGRLICGYKKGLHTYEGEVDLSEIHQGRLPHVHWKGGHILEDILIKGGKVFFKEEKERYERMKNIILPEEVDGKYVLSDKSMQHIPPIYTLSGLYENLPNEKMNTKIAVLTDEIKKHNPDFEFNSIAKSKELRLKLLENKYRRLVSDQ